MKRYYFKISSLGFILLSALFSVGCNYTFLSKIYAAAGILFGLLTGIILFCIFCGAYSLLFIKKAEKWLAAFFIIGNGAALYFMQTYNVAVDKVMMLNVFQTDAAEVGGLLSTEMILFAVSFCVLPLFLLYKTRIEYSDFRREVKIRLTVIAASFILSGLIILPFSARLDTFVQEHKRLLYTLMPSNYIDSTMSALKIIHKHHDFKPLDKKAELNDYWKNNGRKNLFIVIV